MSEQEDIAREVLDTLDLGPAGGRVAKEVEVEVVRPLNEGDLPAIMAGLALPTPAQRLKRLGHAHHRLAQMLVEGLPPEKISAITGYSTSYIGAAQKDPSFRELIAYYAANAELIYVDVLERMKNLQVASLEELQKRLDEEPEGWTKRELMELSDMMGKPMIAKMQGRQGGEGAAGGGGIQIGIHFVSPAGAAGVKSAVVAAATAIDPDATTLETIDVE